MRRLLAAGVVLLGAAAAVVPLPLSVAQPSVLVAVAEVATVTVSEEFLEAAAQRLEPVTGTYYTVPHHNGPPLAEVLIAAMSGARDVVGPVAAPTHELARPEVVAALTGLGLSPARMEGAPLPVSVAVDGGVDPGALGVALHLFDAMSALDVAAGRRIVGLGSMGPDQSLLCSVPPEPTLAAARDADLVVVPTACGTPASASPGAAVVVAGTFTEAVDAVMAAQQG